MQKKGLSFTVFLLSLNFISAYSGSFSLGEILSDIDPSTLILGSLLLIFFAFLNFALSKFFKENKAAAGVVAFLVSLLLVYGINLTGMDYENFFYNIGLSEEIITTIFPFLILGAFVIGIIKIGIGSTLMLFGFSLFAVSGFTDWIYESEVGMFFGVILIGFGAWLYNRKKKSINDWSNNQNISYTRPPSGPGWIRRNYNWEKEKAQGRWIGKKVWGGTKIIGKGVGAVGKQMKKTFDERERYNEPKIIRNNEQNYQKNLAEKQRKEQEAIQRQEYERKRQIEEQQKQDVEKRKEQIKNEQSAMIRQQENQKKYEERMQKQELKKQEKLAEEAAKRQVKEKTNELQIRKKLKEYEDVLRLAQNQFQKAQIHAEKLTAQADQAVKNYNLAKERLEIQTSHLNKAIRENNSSKIKREQASWNTNNKKFEITKDEVSKAERAYQDGQIELAKKQKEFNEWKQEYDKEYSRLKSQR
ncbi:MAG: hypothetical protein KJ646_03170 [Nanoarchaeota archaeon]|nr:hypothetical protein [Nanoarchaeota archaeon]MBU4117068.1 hypothetical protein [Nanoarchaeota archaeon]